MAASKPQVEPNVNLKFIASDKRHVDYGAVTNSPFQAVIDACAGKYGSYTIFEVETPDGRLLEVQAPANATPDDVRAIARKRLAAGKTAAGLFDDVLQPENQGDAAATDAAQAADASAEPWDDWKKAPLAESPSFHGSPCTSDCSGHDAGYEWAEENDITDPDDCGGNSDSFIKGCRAWAKENG